MTMMSDPLLVTWHAEYTKHFIQIHVWFSNKKKDRYRPIHKSIIYPLLATIS